MKESKLIKDQQIHFEGEKGAFKVSVINDNYAICTRKLNKIYDAELLHHQVDMGAFLSFEEARRYLKDDMIYSIIDFKNKKRGTHNLVFNPYDFKDIDSMNKLLNDLESGEVELSTINNCELKIVKA